MTEADAHLWFKIVIPGKGAIGPGKIDLLRAVEAGQSISAAARQLGMSYRRAWTLLDETKRIAGAEIVETRSGGAEGGGARLTTAGQRLVTIYDRVAAKADKAADNELAALRRLEDEASKAE